MDNLAKDAFLAKRAGMTYGKWKANNPSTAGYKVELIPDGWRKCECCGKPYKPARAMQKFCELSCRDEARAMRLRDERIERKRVKLNGNRN